jgi:hypothetical protein
VRGEARANAHLKPSGFRQRQLAISLPFLLEAGCSARASADYLEMMDEFDLLFPRVEIAAAMEDRAF